jgi:hypothetical protein
MNPTSVLMARQLGRRRGPTSFVKCFVGSSGRKQESCQPLMGCRIRTVEIDGAPKFSFCAIPVQP